MARNKHRNFFYIIGEKQQQEKIELADFEMSNQQRGKNGICMAAWKQNEN